MGVDSINVYVFISSGNVPNAILSVPRAQKSPEDLNSERFHLVLGLSVKALCSTRLTYTPETITSCINAVNCLLDAPWAREYIGHNDVSRKLLDLSIEKQDG